MQEITITRKVTVKHIVTEKLRNDFSNEIKGALFQVENEINDFDKETRKAVTEMTLKGNPRVNQIKDHLEQERQKMVVYQEQLKQKIENVLSWKEGEEIVQSTFDSPLLVKIGDSLSKINEAEIIVKDDIIVEIRE